MVVVRRVSPFALILKNFLGRDLVEIDAESRARKAAIMHDPEIARLKEAAGNATGKAERVSAKKILAEACRAKAEVCTRSRQRTFFRFRAKSKSGGTSPTGHARKFRARFMTGPLGWIG